LAVVAVVAAAVEQSALVVCLNFTGQQVVAVVAVRFLVLAVLLEAYQ
jgi:hypothetical protein